MATGRSRTEIEFLDKGINAGSPLGVTVGAAFFPKMGPLGVTNVSNYNDLLRNFTPYETLNRGYSNEYSHLKYILLRNKNVLVSRVIETPKNAGIVFYWDSASKQIKIKNIILKTDEDYKFANKSEFLVISTKLPGAWSENAGLQFSAGTAPSTLKIEVILGLFENKKSVITSGGYIVEKFDNLHFDHTTVDNFIEMINYDSNFIEVHYNRDAFSEPVEEFKKLKKLGSFNFVPSVIEKTVTGTNNIGVAPETLNGTIELNRVETVISDFVLDNTYTIYVNGNRYEVSTQDTFVDNEEKLLNKFKSVIESVETNLEITVNKDEHSFIMVEKVGSLTFNSTGKDKLDITVASAIPNQSYKFQVLNEDFEIKFISKSNNVELNKKLLASEIATILTERLTDVEIHLIDDKISIRSVDASLNLGQYIVHPVEKLMSNLKVSRVSVLNYRIGVNGIVDPSMISSKYVFKNIVDFDGATGHTYASLSVFGSQTPKLPTVNLINRATGDFEYSDAIVALEDERKIDILPYSIWNHKTYKFREGELFLILAKNPGDWANDIEVSISNENDQRLRYTNTFMIDVKFGAYSEQFEVTLDKDQKSGYNRTMFVSDVVNSESRYINILVNPAISDDDLKLIKPESTSVIDSVTQKEYPVAVKLTGGYDGSPLASEYINAINKFKGDNYGVKVLASLGNEFDDYLRALSNVGDEIEALPVVSVPRALTLSKDVDRIVKWARSLNFQDTGAVYINSVLEFEPDLNYDVEITGDTIFASFVGEVVRKYKRVSEPVAGLEKTAITGVKGTLINITAGEEDRLYDNNINPVTTLNNIIYLNGQKTMKQLPGFLDRINVKLYTLFKKPVLREILNRYRHRLHHPEVRNEIVVALTASFQNDVNEGSIKPGFKIQCDENNNPESGDQHELYINGAICPVESIEWIFSNFALTKNAVSVKLSV